MGGKSGKGSIGVIGAAADSKSGKGKSKGYSEWDDGSGYDAKGAGKGGGKGAAKGGKLQLSLSRPGFAGEPPLKRAREAYEAPMDGPEAACQDPLVLDSESTIAFYIPSDSIGKVLGKQGVIANEIRSASGCQLKIETGEQDATVTLSGSLQGVHAAHCMVVARVMSDI